MYFFDLFGISPERPQCSGSMKCTKTFRTNNMADSRRVMVFLTTCLMELDDDDDDYDHETTAAVVAKKYSSLAIFHYIL